MCAAAACCEENCPCRDPSLKPPAFCCAQKLSPAYLAAVAAHGCDGARVQSTLRFNTLLELLHGGDGVAILGTGATSAQQPTTHAALQRFLAADIPQQLQAAGVGDLAGRRIGCILPNGPEAGVAVLTAMTYGTCCPINPAATKEEMLEELQAFGVHCCLLMSGQAAESAGYVALPSGLTEAVQAAGIRVLSVLPSSQGPAGLFQLEATSPAPARQSPTACCPVNPTTRQELALLLHTSGTSGKKKIVPYTLDTLAVGATCVAASWALRPQDVCLNMMPLFHTGGIVRNLLAPLLAGGATCLELGFEPRAFWSVVERLRVTWYYAAPTIHLSIIQEVRRMGCVPSHCVRLVGNAAGPLVPSLAADIKSTFGAATAVLPSYGMTECMPISSPPVDYQLDRPGTSGRAVGPQLSIRSPSLQSPLPAGEVGHICVRGPPLFSGYMGDAGAGAGASSSPFTHEGWFDTGDLGYLDTDSYLFITGRSKEVINRGGEIISPAEVEDAVGSHPAVGAVAAISVGHDALQEVVGVLVATRRGMSRPSLKQLQSHVLGTLHPSKWPQLVVYMDAGLPITATNKVTRVNMAQRLGLPEITDRTPLTKRLFEAETPEKGADIRSDVPCRLISMDVRCIEGAVHATLASAASRLGYRLEDSALTWSSDNELCAFAVVGQGEEAEAKDWGQVLLDYLHDNTTLPQYWMPSAILPVPSIGRKPGPERSLDEDWARLTLNTHVSMMMRDSSDSDASSGLCDFVTKTMVELLEVEAEEVQPDDDFFALGGNSLKAGRLLSALRVALPALDLQVGMLYSMPTAAKLALGLRQLGADESMLPDAKAKGAKGEEVKESFAPDCQPYSATAPAALLIQALPLFILHPLRRLSIHFMFILILSTLPDPSPISVMYQISMNILRMGGAAAITGIITQLVMPWLGIAVKWAIIGRYHDTGHRPHPLFGSMYLRWWMVRQMLELAGRGCFMWSNWSLNVYYRLLGAQIGRNAVIHKHAELGEYDLIHVADGAWVGAKATLRPFHLVTGGFALKRISLGRDCTVSSQAIVLPGAVLPERSAVGPRSSSVEVRLEVGPEEARKYARDNAPGPHFLLLLLVAWPLMALVEILAHIPQYLVLGCMLATIGDFSSHVSAGNVQSLLLWFATSARYPFFMLIRMAQTTAVPCLQLFFGLVVKHALFGPLRPGPRTHSQWERLHYYLLEALLSGRRVQRVSRLLGANLSGTSWLLRRLGAKVGQGVFLSGSGFDTMDYDLIEIGDHAVFGSRSSLVCSGAHERVPIRIGPGAMLADRCNVQPGGGLGRNAVMGSGGFIPAGFVLPDGSTWLGCKDGVPALWSKGPAGASTAPTDTPFSRAYAKGGTTPYLLWPAWLHTLFNFTMTALVAAYWTTPLICSLAFAVGFLYKKKHFLFNDTDFNELLLGEMAIMAAVYVATYGVITVVAVLVDVAAKWMIIGQRKAGRYPWDESDYCQRWIIHKTIQSIRTSFAGKVYQRICGSQYLTWYQIALGAKIGKNVCLYPNMGDPVMTEPDLVTIGDCAAIDNASLITHINSRGVFQLNELLVGEFAVMRTKTRLLSGAVMRPYSTLLEHTLVVSGEEVTAGSVWQGWPGRAIHKRAVHKRGPRPLVSVVVHQAPERDDSSNGSSGSSSSSSGSSGSGRRVMTAAATAAAAAPRSQAQAQDNSSNGSSGSSSV